MKNKRAPNFMTKGKKEKEKGKTIVNLGDARPKKQSPQADFDDERLRLVDKLGKLEDSE